MSAVIDSVNLIGKTMDDMLDFIAKDDTLAHDFEQYLEKNKIELASERDFNNIMIEYLLDMKMQSGLRVLEYYSRNSNSDKKIINSLLNSFCAVFQVDKIQSNAYEVTCLTSNAKTILIPMVKMTHLKQIGRYDYIKARIIELNGAEYILEIYDIISEYNPYKATVEAIIYMLINPKTAYYKNPDKKQELEQSVVQFKEKFTSYFKNNFIITTNKCVDELIECFNLYYKGENNIDYTSLIQKTDKNQYIELSKYSANDDFIQNAIGGFSSHKETYDVGLWMDEKRGLYIIPFLETFFKCFEGDVENKNNCIKELITSDKVPPSVVKYAYDKYPNFFEVVNCAFESNFSTIEEVLSNTKTMFIDEGIFSPVTILYNSSLFGELLGLKEKEEEKEHIAQNKTVGRNDPCPCGSGLKYKNCCGKN